MTAPQETRPGLGQTITEGPWEGWRTWTGNEPFEEAVGPFYARQQEDGSYLAGFRPGPRSQNGAGFVHGGALATFADYSLFTIATSEVAGEAAVTVTLNTEFVAAVPIDALLTSHGDVARSGRNLVFVRGLMEADGSLVLSFSGVLKVLRTET